MVPINFSLSHLLVKMRKQRMTVTDERIKACNEVLQGIRIVKYFGWEASYVDRIMTLRKKEMSFALGESYCFAMAMVCTVFLPIIAVSS